jgi:hypothetical protein
VKPEDEKTIYRLAYRSRFNIVTISLQIIAGLWCLYCAFFFTYSTLGYLMNFMVGMAGGALASMGCLFLRDELKKPKFLNKVAETRYSPSMKSGAS